MDEDPPNDTQDQNREKSPAVEPPGQPAITAIATSVAGCVVVEGVRECDQNDASQADNEGVTDEEDGHASDISAELSDFSDNNLPFADPLGDLGTPPFADPSKMQMAVELLQYDLVDMSTHPLIGPSHRRVGPFETIGNMDIKNKCEGFECPCGGRKNSRENQTFRV